LNILMISREEYLLLSLYVCSFPQSPLTSTLLGSDILFSTLFSNTLSLYSSLMWETKCHASTKLLAKLEFPIFWSLHFYAADEETKDPELNGSKRSPNAIFYC
jgi:hypothetical protein